MQTFEDATPSSGEDALASTCELVLVVLEQLHVSFEKLGRQEEAGPLLDRLTAIAYGATPRMTLQ